MKKTLFFIKVLALCAIYFVTAKWGLALDAVSGFATLVWPPTGISLAFLLLFGLDLWPGVFLGALLANLDLHAPASVCLGIATGNTLEAICGFFLLRRLTKIQNSLGRTRDIFGLILLAGVTSTFVSAIIGSTTLFLGGIISAASFSSTMGAWWMGDFLGNLVMAPLLLVWIARPLPHFTFANVFETTIIGLIVIVVCMLIGGLLPVSVDSYALTYLVFPVFIWTALRFGLRGVTLAILFVSIIAIFGTIHKMGPFTRGSLSLSLVYLQVFIGTLAVTSLILAAVVEAAKVANLAKSAFLATMSHEIRTPLGAILGFTDILMEANLETGERLKYTQIIRKSGKQLSNLINDILDLSKIEGGHFEIEKTKIHLKNIVTEIIALLDVNAQQKQLKLLVSFEKNVPEFITSDATRLRQILVNIVGNAIKFTEKGSVSLTIQYLDKGQSKKPTVVFRVQDTGIGLKREQKERLFKPFSQADSSITRKFGGTGLGLILSQKMAQALGGDIVLADQKPNNLGCTFLITIPSQE